MDFYDIEPRAGSHYLFKNGQEIARYNELARALQVRTQVVAELAQELQKTPGPWFKNDGRK